MGSKKRIRLLLLLRREMRRLASRPIYLMSMVGAPLICFIFFTSLMRDGLPQDIPVAAVDADNTATSRSILRNLDAFQQTEIVHQYSNFAEARKAMQEGKIYGFFYIPEGTTRKANRSEQPRISFYTNASYLIPASLVYRDMKMMSELAAGAAGRTSLLARGYTDDQAMAFLQPIKIETHAISNPWLNYSVYLSNTLLPAVLMLMIFLVTIFSVQTELKDGTGRQWIELAGGRTWLALFGKLLPHTVIFTMMIFFAQIYLYKILDFPLNGAMWHMLLLGLMFVLASQNLALFICGLIPSLRWSLSLATLWGVLSFPICGFSFPVMAMPPAIQSLSAMFPLRYYYLIYVDQALNGWSLQYSVQYYAILLIFIVLPLTDMHRIKHSMQNYEYLP